MKLRDALILLPMFLILMGCSDEITSQNLSSQEDANQRVEEKLNEFYSEINDGSRSSAEVKVLSFTNQSYQIVNGAVISAKTAGNSSDSQTFDLTTAIINVEDNQGYAILSLDENIDKVFFFTENGSLTDSCNIEALKAFMDIIPQTAADILLNGVPPLPQELATAKSSRSETYLVSQLCRFKWGQRYPFNRNMPVCNDSDCSNYQGNYLTGCATTAACQMIATIGEFDGYVHRNKSIDFDYLPEYGSGATETQAAILGHFFHEVAMGLQVKFGCTGTNCYPKNIYNFLIERGYDCEYETGNIDISKLLLELTEGIPHIICGYTTSGSGHAWIIDGLKITDGVYGYHCNWGWNGSSNGYSIGTPYAYSGTQYSQNLIHIYTYGYE